MGQRKENINVKTKRLQVRLRFIQFACTVEDQSDYLLTIAGLQELIGGNKIIIEHTGLTCNLF